MEKKDGLKLENRITTLENQYNFIIQELKDLKENHLHDLKERIDDVGNRINWLIGVFVIQFFALLFAILMYLLNKK